MGSGGDNCLCGLVIVEGMLGGLLWLWDGVFWGVWGCVLFGVCAGGGGLGSFWLFSQVRVCFGG